MKLRVLGIGITGAALLTMGLWSGIGSAGWLAGTDNQAVIGLRATLRAGAEVPRPTGVPAIAGGRFTAGLTRRGTGGTLTWRLTFHDLTGRGMAAHVHRGKPGQAGPVAVALCGPCRSGIRRTTRVNARTVRAILAGRAYVNVHTKKNPAGEIRGQIKKGGTAPPPPTTTDTTTTTTTTTTTYYP